MEVSYGEVDAETLKRMSGLELLTAMIRRELPAPAMAERLQFRLVDVQEGFARFEGDVSERLLNPLGLVHGGWALTLIDSAAGCAVHTKLAAGVGYTTVETKVNFTRPIPANGGRYACEGRVVHHGRQISTAEAKLMDHAGRIVAHGTSTLMIFSAR